MTTQRLYYTDATTTAFHAQIVEQVEVQGAPAVVLDATYFYPTSGGQPNDLGYLNGVAVTNVVVREGDGAVLHVLADPLPPGDVHGQIDWARRFDHMQHHTGQHILSQAFIQVAGAETVGFHISPDSVTIDLDRPQIDAAVAQQVEDRANEVLAENRPVRVLFPNPAEVAALPLRKVPEVDGPLRVIEVEGFDITACGGTHVGHSAEVGMIKILRIDRRGDTARVEFRCGRRALLDYRQKNDLMLSLAASLTVGYWEVPDALERLRTENQGLRRDLRGLRESLIKAEAERLWEQAARRDGYALVSHTFEGRDVAEVRLIAQHLIAHPATVALCAAAGDKAQLIAARSDELPFDMVDVLKHGLAAWGVDRGGGRPSFAQGGGVRADLDAAAAALAAAVQALERQSEG